MKAPIVMFALLLLHQNRLFAEAQPEVIDCSDFESTSIPETIVAAFLVAFKSKSRKDVKVNFYLSTELIREHIEINSITWPYLRENSFDPNKKTYIIVHGYNSNGKNTVKSKLIIFNVKMLEGKVNYV